MQNEKRSGKIKDLEKALTPLAIAAGIITIPLSLASVITYSFLKDYLDNHIGTKSIIPRTRKYKKRFFEEQLKKAEGGYRIKNQALERGGYFLGFKFFKYLNMEEKEIMEERDFLYGKIKILRGKLEQLIQSSKPLN